MKVLKIWVLSGILLILTACGGGGGSSSGGDQSSTSNAPSESLEDLIVVLGDSISTGFNASFAYPDLLASLTGISVRNLAKDGQPAEYGAQRIAEIIEIYRPKYVVVLLGTLNASGGNGGGVNAAVSSLQFVANVASSAGAIPIIGTLPPITRSSTQNANASAISDGIRSIGNARIAEIAGAISPSLIEDGLHPNDQGQAIIARLFAAQIF